MEKGFLHVAGVDEAGKGPLAGPVAAGAVVIHSEHQVIPYVKDSKFMTEKQREKAFEAICKKSSAFGIGTVSQEYIDKKGIDIAVRKAMLIALKQLEQTFNIKISYVLVDGSKTKPLKIYASQRIKAGGLHQYTIAAASVLAKVTRDRIMRQFAKQYPFYGFEKHVGYGTKKHLEALQKYGPCGIHRKSYVPVKNISKVS